MEIVEQELKCEIKPDPLDISKEGVASYETIVSESSSESFTIQEFSGGVKRKLKYCCDFCNFESSFELIFKEHLMSHKKFKCSIAGYPVHKNWNHLCDQCDHAATTAGILKRHKQSKHEGLRILVINMTIVPQ